MSRHRVLASRLLFWAFVLFGMNLPSMGPAQDAKQRALADVSAAFIKADQNGDGELSLEEFLVNRGDAKVATRDFRLFDLDEDGKLGRAEFGTVPTVVALQFRGELPDPMTDVVDSIMSGLDKAHNNWDQKPETALNADGFVAAFANRFAINPPPNVEEADPDRSGTVTRAEARRFLEIQLGVRRNDGKQLRMPNGCVIDYRLFTHIDENQNDRLERKEYAERSYAAEKATTEFDAADTNRDDALSFDEFATLGRAMADPVQDFRRMDTDLDGTLGRDELLEGTPEWKKQIAQFVFPGFDLNRDDRLSLSEYRLTMQANPVAHWTYVRSDADGDGTLSFAEFRYEPIRFPMLRMVYFNRLDQNSNKKLETTEFAFNVKKPDEFFSLSEDGSEWKSLFKFEGRPACGSPAVSPDGKWLAFDAWPQGQMGGSALYVKQLDGGEPHQVCLGMMPNWSSDGKRLACSRNTPAYGAWIVDLADNDHKYLCEGWGAQWSPDGKRIAFTQGSNIQAYDIETEKTTTLLEAGGDNLYQQIYWNMGWSPDSKQLCFKGIKPGGINEVATINAVGTGKPNLKVRYSTKSHLNADFAWHPKGHRIVFAAYSPERKQTQLMEFHPDKDDPPVFVKGQDEKRNNTDMAWTPDGKRLIVVSGDY